MPPSSPGTLRTGLRFCASCAGTLACWAVWLVLGALLASLLYIATARELPVPDFMLRRAEAGLAQAGITVKFGRARLDPRGIVLLENVQFRTRSFEEPLLTCRQLYLRREFWSALAGRLTPDEIRLEGATLQLTSIFDWYGDDFLARYGKAFYDVPGLSGKQEAAVNYLATYADPAMAVKLRAGNYKTVWMVYDWGVNGR